MATTSRVITDVLSPSSTPTTGFRKIGIGLGAEASPADGSSRAAFRRLSSPGEIQCTLASLVGAASGSDRVSLIEGDESYAMRVSWLPLSFSTYRELLRFVRYVGVTANFRRVIDYFKVPEGELPAGFRLETNLEADCVLRLDLVRDIAYGKNAIKRPTNVLFSADTANPYEVEPVKGLISNLTCNPGIIYDLFINNPKANIGHQFNNRDEVLRELGTILGPGCDISVELNNPFAKSEQEILDEVDHFKELLSEYRIVIKVPHTGPVNADNMDQLLAGDKKLHAPCNQVGTKDAFRGHNLALLLHDRGIRVNFTLMFEPYQALLALQAKPYFINCFIRHRVSQSQTMKRDLDLFSVTADAKHLEHLRAMLVEADYLPPEEQDLDLLKVKQKAENILRYRKFESAEGSDGLDAVRHNLRLLRNTNLPDTRLILCSMEGERNYPDIDDLLADECYEDVMDRVVVTAEPNYLAQFATSSQVISYQRRFLNAAKGQS